MGFDEALTVCQLFSNYLNFLMLSLMAPLCSFVTRQGGQVHLMSLSQEGEFISPISSYLKDSNTL